MAAFVSEELLGTFVPVIVYWLYFDDYRLHPRKEEDAKNLASKSTVVKGVLVQQAFQIVVSLLLFTVCLNHY
ncbi:Sphinganine C(4)-monooxygenase 1 [Acorus gramineus]|uniref:Sphinganine C(4)-monooxygenase 1 n=1 Tax=Acorus gramineus TaxID=55184 RepID=A0AAV9A8P0_ACOGR|nr:Sphinganine C(4)-monooxygenase 1 [Acorus gramineus]